MTGRSHLAISGAAYLALALGPVTTPLGAVAAPRLDLPYLTGLSAALAGAFVAAAAGLAPDMDKSGSKAARAGGWPTRLLAWTLQLFLGHRRALHSLVAVAAVWYAGALLGPPLLMPGLGAVLAFGWTVHLLLDALTSSGVPLLWPLPLRVRLPPGLTTGGLAELLLVLTLLALCLWWIDHTAPLR